MIDRRSLVRRHNPSQQGYDPFAVLSVGNGEFAFTADLTGLQTFPEACAEGIPLCTLAQWGWHSFPTPPGELKLTPHFNGEREVGYATDASGQAALFNALRQSPHRLHLGRVGLELRTHGRATAHTDLRNPTQTLDLWTGHLRSSFELDNHKIVVETFCHPHRDAVCFSLEAVSLDGSPPVLPGLVLAFPYGSPEKSAADWSYRGPNHLTEVVDQKSDSIAFRRSVDDQRVFVEFQASQPCRFDKNGDHSWTAYCDAARVECAVGFSQASTDSPLPSYAQASAETRRFWEHYWSDGGAIDFSAVDDTRALELERRVVLSQYLCAIQCSGFLPPAETGLTCNSWYGKFHLEMHWWHSAHFALWGRPGLFERSLGYYRSILASARERAGAQGYRGARWPKMTDPSGRDSPSHIGTLLIWQQPHVIYYAELLFRLRPEALGDYGDLVEETAEFMASYARYDAERDRYVLGPGLIPAQENHAPSDTLNPTFELAYWRWGFETAQTWRRRAGLPPRPEWQKVLDKLSLLPQKDGVYLAHENCPDTYGAFAHDHPSFLAACGMLPADADDTVRLSLQRVFKDWDWESLWGWDFPLMAMTAARLGDPEAAVDVLLKASPKNTYSANGHNRQKGVDALPVYLPGNGGVLMAAAMMAAGWDGSTSRNPGFPPDWNVQWEGLKCMP